MKKVTRILTVMAWMAFGLSGLQQMPVLYAAPKADVKVIAPAQPVNINKAGAEELQTLRGVGPALAGRIMQYREEHGPFKKVEDLNLVNGIGDSKLSKMKDQVTL